MADDGSRWDGTLDVGCGNDKLIEYRNKAKIKADNFLRTT